MIRQALRYMLHTNREVLKKIIDDISEEESMQRGTEGLNHIRWLTGHLLYSHLYVHTLLGKKEEEWKELKGLFGAGSKISDDPTAYPSMADVRKQLYAAIHETIERVERIPDADLVEEIGEEDRKKPKWNSLVFFAMHDFYHAGQMVAIYRVLGREHPFG